MNKHQIINVRDDHLCILRGKNIIFTFFSLSRDPKNGTYVYMLWHMVHMYNGTYVMTLWEKPICYALYYLLPQLKDSLIKFTK